MIIPIGWPTTQNIHQKMAFPMNALSNLRSIILVTNIKGACANIPKKAWSETRLKGIDIINSWKTAENANADSNATSLGVLARSKGWSTIHYDNYNLILYNLINIIYLLHRCLVIQLCTGIFHVLQYLSIVLLLILLLSYQYFVHNIIIISILILLYYNLAFHQSL